LEAVGRGKLRGPEAVMTREEIYIAITKEREYQDVKWGRTFDDQNTANDWLAYIVSYAGKALTYPWNREQFRKAILKTAALCVVVLEREEYPPRHYD